MDRETDARPERPVGEQASPGAGHVLSEECRRLIAAQRILSVRKLRDVEFDLSAIGDPGFSMLLALHVLEATGKLAGLEALEQAAGVPIPVAVRWLKALEMAGLTTSGRRYSGGPAALIEITPLGRAKLARYLDSIVGFVTESPS